MKNKKLIRKSVFLILTIFFVSCGNSNHSNDNISMDDNSSMDTNSSSSSSPTVEAKKTLVFANHAKYGIEPWISDGTAEGTTLLKDINIKKDLGSNIRHEMVSIGSTLYFIADDGIHGRELWKSDGSTIAMVQDIHVGASSSNIRNLTNVDGTLYFSADNGIDGNELWKYDGVVTSMVKNIFDGSDGSHPRFLTNVRGVLYFTADNGINGRELWKSTGTESSTVLVKDIVVGGESSEPKELTNVEGVLYFSAEDGTHGRELWKSDGTEANTLMQLDIQVGTEGSSLTEFTAVGDTLYFVADDGAVGKELWRSHGATTELVMDIGRNSNPSHLININGVLFFTARDDTHGNELWFYTLLGPVMIDISEGAGSSSPKNLIDVNGTLYFTAVDITNGSELRKYNLRDGLSLVQDITEGRGSTRVDNLTNVNGTLYFSINKALWKSDGTEVGTEIVRDTAVDENPLRIRMLFATNEMLYMVANDGIHGEELWKSDGTSEGTVLAKDIRQTTKGSVQSYLNEYLKIENTHYFVAQDNIHGDELWKSDGTEAGTSILKDIQEGEESSFPQMLRNVNGTLYFSANDATHGNELWKSDGTEAGTVLAEDINRGSRSIFINDMIVLNDTLYFTIALFGGDNTGIELWKSNTNGTVLIKKIGGGEYSSIGLIAGDRSIDSSLINVGNTLYFSANDGTHGNELWKSDGTEVGTILVKNIHEGDRLFTLTHSNPQELHSVNGQLYFSADDGVHGRELWKSDGTEVGTVLLKNIRDDSGAIVNSNPKNIISIHDKAYFTITTDFRRNELWQSNGTEDGTVLIKLFEGKSIEEMKRVNNQLYLNIRVGWEDGFNTLWKSDGTEEGTQEIDDFNGSLDDINMLDTFDNKLLFRTEDKYGVSKLWKSDGSSTGTQVLVGAESEAL